MAGLGFDITGDSKDFMKSIREAEGGVEKFSEDVQKMGKQIELTYDQAVSKAKELQSQIESLKKSMTPLMNPHTDAYNKLENYEFAFSTGGKVDDGSGEKQIEVTKEKLEAVRAEFDKLNLVIEDHRGRLKPLEEEYRSTMEAIAQKVRDGAESVGKDLEKSVTAPDAIRTKLSEVVKSISELDQKFGELKKNAGVISEKDIQLQKEYRDELSRLEKELKGIAAYTQNESISNPKLAEQYEAVRSILREVRAELKGVSASIDDGSKKELTYLTQIRQIREEMAQMRGADGVVSPQNMQRYEDLRNQLQEVGTALNIVRREQRMLTTAGSADLAGLIQGITGLSGAFAAGQGVVSLFVKDNEKLAAIQTKLQAAMAITMGLQQVSNTLHATSNFRIVTLTKITNLWRASILSVGTALIKMGASANVARIAAQALMGVLSLGLSVAIIGAITLIDKFRTEQSKLAESTKKFNDTLASSAANQIMEFEKLRKQWVSAGEDLKKKEKLVRENTDAYNSFGIKINGVNDADKLFIDNAGAFRESMISRAKSVAAMELATEKYKEYLTAMADAERRATDRTFLETISDGLESLGNRGESLLKMISTGNYVESLGENYFAKQASMRAGQDAEKLNRESQRWLEKAFGYDEETRNKLKSTGGQLTDEIIEGSKTHWQKIRNEQQKIMDENMPGSDIFKAAKKQRDIADKMLQKWDKSNFKREDSQAQKMREASLKLLNLQSELDNESIKQQLDHEQKLLDIEQDSFDKRYRQNQLNTAKESLSVEEYRQKMAKAQQDAAKDIYVKKNGSDTGFNFASYSKEDKEKMLPEGLRPSDIESQAKKMMDAIVATYKKGYADITKEQQIFWNEENMMFASELDKQLDAIRTHYEERRKTANVKPEDINIINDNETREIAAARLQARQKQLEVDADYNQKYIQLVTDRYVFEADKRKEALQQQIKDQESIINNLSDQLLNNPNNDELARRLRAAKLELKLFNNELKKTSAEKFSEIASEISNVASTLRSALDDFGVSFSDSANKVLDGGMQILDGAGKMAKGIKDMDVSSFIQGMIEQTQGYFNVIGGLFGPNGTAEYESIRAQLEGINQIYQKIIASNKENIVFGGGYAAITAASDAMDTYEKKVANLKRIAEASGGAGAAWNSHSAGWHTNKNVGAGNFLEMGKIIDKSVTSISDLYNLTGDELYLIQSQMPEAWGLIDERIRENLQSIIDCKDEAGELRDALNEALTGVSQDAFYNDFINNLSDMSMSWEDMCDNFEDSLRKSILAALLAQKYKPQIDALYESWAEAARLDAEAASDGVITEAEKEASRNRQEALRNRNEELAKQMIKDRENMAATFGWDYEDKTSASSKGIQSLSQDSGNEIIGIGNSLLNKVGDIRNINEASRVQLVGIGKGIGDIQAIMRENSKVFQDNLIVQVKIEQNTFRTAEILNKIDTTGVTIRD